MKHQVNAKQKDALDELKQAITMAGDVCNDHGESLLDLLQMRCCRDKTVDDFCDTVELFLSEVVRT